MTDSTTAAFSAGTDVIKAAAEAATAQELARAADTAALLDHVDKKLEEHNRQNLSTITNSMKDIVGDALGNLPTRYFDVSRIPLLCKSIFDMQENQEKTSREQKEDLNELKEMIKEDRVTSEKEHTGFVRKDGEYWVIRTIVFTGAGLVLVGVFTLVLNSVLK